jgi:hypothetical protein
VPGRLSQNPDEGEEQQQESAHLLYCTENGQLSV